MKVKKVRRILGMLLIACTLMGTMTGCGNQVVQEDEKEETAVQNSESESKVEESEEINREDVTLVWYMPIGTNPENEVVFEAASEMVKEKMGVNLEIRELTFGEYESKIQVLCAANATFDIMYTSNWANSYYNNVSDGTLLPLDDLLKEVPELYESVPEYYWNGVKVDGKIYAVPNQQLAARSPGVIIPERNLELLNIDMNEYGFCDDYKVFLNNIEKYLTALNAETNTYAVALEFWSDGIGMFGMEEIVGSKLPGAIMFDSSEPTKIINQYETQEFLDYITARRKWQQAGLIQPEVYSDDLQKITSYVEGDGAIPFIKVCPNKPGVEAEEAGTAGFEVALLMETTPIMSTGATISTMNGISATSEYPELAMELIELINTDKELYNLLSFGIEGRNYTKEDDNRITKSTENVYNGINWAIGNVYNSYLLPSQEEDIWEQTKSMNDESESSPLLGFSPNLTEIQTEVAGCTSVISEYYDLLVYGVVDVDEVYQEFLDKLEAAGSEKIIAEIQSQVDAWLK